MKPSLRNRRRQAPRRRFRSLILEQLEGRLLLANDIEVILDPIFDTTGFQPETTQFYEDMGSLGSIFDTGAAVVTFSALDQLVFDPFAEGHGIPIIEGAVAEAEGIGGTLYGDVSQPGTIIVDGIHANVFTGDIFQSGSYFDQTEGRGSVATPSSNVEFFGDTGLNAEDDVYNGLSLLYTSPGTNNGEYREITDYDGATRKFTVDTGFPAAPVVNDTFHIILGQGQLDGSLPSRDRFRANPDGFGLGHSGGYVGSYLVFTSGELEGDYQLISGYDGATHTFEVALPFGKRPGVGDTFDIIVGAGSSAVMPGVQAFIGTFDGSEILPTIAGTPMLNSTNGLTSTVDHQPLHPNGLALEVGPQELLLDLGELLGDFDEYLGDLFAGITLPIPSVQFRDPGSLLETTEAFFAESPVVDASPRTKSEFSGVDALPYDPENPGLFQDFFKGFHLRFLTGNLAGEMQPVSGYAPDTRTFTFDVDHQFSAAPGLGDVFELVRVSTEPITVGLEFVGADNHLDPGDMITTSYNPVSSDVHIAHRHFGNVTSVTADDVFDGNEELSAEDDRYNGMTVLFTSGDLRGEEGVVTDYIGQDRTFEFATAFTQVPDVGDTFEVVVGSLDDQIFLFDTGAMLSTITEDQAAAMGFDLGAPEFTMSVQGAAGVVEDLPGFTMDELTIPTLPLSEGGELTFRNVPVFVIDVAEEIDGIMGMNLFNSGAEFLYDAFDPNYGHPTLQMTFFNQRSEVAPEEIDTSELDPLGLAFLESLAEVMPGAFGGAVGLREVALPNFGVGVDVDFTPQAGIVTEEDGVPVLTVTPGSSVTFDAKVRFAAETYRSFQLDFGASHVDLDLDTWTTDGGFTVADGNLDFPGDALVSAGGTTNFLSAPLGTFVLTAPSNEGDYLLTANSGGTEFEHPDLTDPLGIRDFGDIIIRVQEAPSLSITDVMLVEGNSGSTDIEFTVTLAGVANLPIAVDYATADITADDAAVAGVDYASLSDTLQFEEGETEKTVSVSVSGDSTAEDDERFVVDLSNARYAPLEATPNRDVTGVKGFILFDDLEDPNEVELRTDTGRAFALEFDLSADLVGATINSATLAFVETLDQVSDPLNLPVWVYGYTDDDTVLDLDVPFNTLLTEDDRVGKVGSGTADTESLDVTSFVQSLLSSGDTLAGFYVETLLDNYYIHSTEAATANRPKLTIEYSMGTGAVDIDGNQGVGTIRNDDTEITISDGEQTEGDAGQTEAAFVVQLSKPSALEVAVDYTTSLGGTAGEGSDYQPASGSVAFAPGETSKAVSVAILGDMKDESDETFFVDLSSPENATIDTARATGTIVDDDLAPTVAITRASSNPTNADTVVFDITFSKDVENVNFSDFVLDRSGVTTDDLASGDVTNAGDANASTYQLTVSNVAGDGTLGLDIASDTDITDLGGNGLDQTPTADGTYTIYNAPTIQSITSTTVDGSYNAGDTIDVTVAFSENVTLTGGTLDVTLDTTDVVSIAVFSNSSTASGTYTVGAGDTSADLDSTTIALSGGTLRDGAGNDATVSLPGTTIADGSDIVIDTTAPTPTIAGPASPTGSDPFDVTIDFGETVIGFLQGDITVVNGSVTNITDNGNGNFTATIDVAAAGQVTVDVAANVADDQAGNANLAAAQFSVTYAADQDQDGVSNDTEDGAPNGGDGNNDQTADSQQPEVASFPNTVDGTYVTLAAPAGTALVGVTATDNPSPGDAPDGVEFPIGFCDYTVTGVDVGGSVVVTVYPASGAVVNVYYKYGPTLGNTDDHWYPFIFDGQTGAKIFADRIELYFIDGARGDDDLAENGIIVDPGAPGGTGFLWQNPVLPEDVNGDTLVTTLDVLTLIADINAQRRDLPATLQGSSTLPPYPDVDPDYLLTTLDVLTVITHINAQARGGPEGESAGLSLSESPIDSLMQSEEIVSLPDIELYVVQSTPNQTVAVGTVGDLTPSRAGQSDVPSRTVSLCDTQQDTELARPPRTDANAPDMTSLDDGFLDSILEDIVPDVHHNWRTD